jgi:type IV secretion system protein VirB2
MSPRTPPVARFAIVPTAMLFSIEAAAGPFVTGATGMVDFGLTIATPIAILIVIGLGIAAAVGKISWGWMFGAILGIACIFGSAQIVEWIRGLFGV